MNRRGFFKRFGATIAAVALLQGLIRKDDNIIRASSRSGKEVNPAWVDAEYEVHFWSYGNPIKVGPPPTNFEFTKAKYIAI